MDAFRNPYALKPLAHHQSLLVETRVRIYDADGICFKKSSNV